ncbi:interferon-induced very large GTPase 1-like [Sciurus carolinensis]|uniref:interferon-induced very large GTPase 1-like n=1 Tax=Sciurus carolinensis TaxID=30640 RepID=UPI001FB44F91|nr:interferon-induced very large GTPase 1-like [Sciurus carolinensis]XP_047371625.1 interferon-induced very large GTPase 1-like [Sciurus carolinensis]
MDTTEHTCDKPLLRGKRRQELQEMLRDIGLDVGYWLPKLQENLVMTCPQALQYLTEKDLQKLKSQVRHPWEKRALEKLVDLSHSNSPPELQESPVEMIKRKQKQAEQLLQELGDFLLEGRERQEEAVERKEAELRQAMEIPEEYWPMPEKPLREVMEIMQRQLSPMEQTLSHRQNLPDGDLIRWASGGLALQGIYKTCHQMDLMQQREELLSVPKEFSLFGSQQATQMETKQFISFEEESMFIQTIEKMGFSVTTSANGGGWGIQLQIGMNKSKHSESKETQQTSSEGTYFCSTKFYYAPLASCYFRINELQLSKPALQELKYIEDLLDQMADTDNFPLLRHRTENFFHRFGSHVNQGPLHLGGIYWWKAVSEGFQSDQLTDVKQQAAKALDTYIRGSYSGFPVKVAGAMDVSHSPSETASQSQILQNFQTKIQLSVVQTGGPPEADGLVQWKAGLVSSNQTWCVIDRGLQLVPIWDIILSSHRSDFQDPLKIANCLKDNYTALTGLSAQIQEGAELLSAGQEARVFLDEVKSWEVSDPEEQLQKLIDVMNKLSQKINGYDTWINICLTDWDLQNFLVNTVNFSKNSSRHKIKFVKSQLRSILYPHIYKVTNFPQAHSIMQWIFQSESELEQLNISQFSQFIEILKETKNELFEVNVRCEIQETGEEAQRKATYEVCLALSNFLNHLQATEQSDTQLLLLSIAAGAGYQVGSNIFRHLLGHDELDFLLDEMQTAYNKYQELKNISSYRAHAFLVLTGLTATAGVTALSAEEKTQRMEFIRKHMGQLFSKEVVHVLTKLGADHDWENLERDLRLLIDGDYEATISSLKMDDVKRQLQSLLHERKQPHEPDINANNTSEVIENGAFLDLLQRLGLEHYYPKRMSRANFHVIYKSSVSNTQPKSEQELSFYFLQKLLMLDYGLRHLVFKDDRNIEYQVPPSASNQENEADPYEEFFKDDDNLTNPLTTESRSHIHPMDIQMAIFHCADNFARQYILTKLSICQFALPLLVPNPCTSQIEFSLWPLRQIRRSWQQASKSPPGKNSHKNQQMCRVSTPIVSFIRVGNGLSASKSQIMNCLLSERKHDVFFHRHCRESSKNCLLMGGVVEICWFCPSGEEEDRFDSCVTFINLHGGAKEHKRQLAFLKEVSSLIVVLMSASDDNEENQKIVRDLWQSSRSLICLLDDKEKFKANNSGRRVKMGLRSRNEAELTEELTATIRRLLECSSTALSMEDCSCIARQQGFLIDEDQRDCKEAKEKAETIMDLLKETELSRMKEIFLPLQGQLWHLWCKKDKELHHLREKGNRSIEQHKSEVEIDKQIIRHRQLTRAFPLNNLMGSLLQILHEYSETHTTLYFLQWLSVFLDSLTAEHLENLREKLIYLWSNVHTEKQKSPNNNSLKLWQNKIEAISTEINDCTLGIEQFLREVGQIYEALEETSSKGDTIFLSLPQIAADLMISGVPIELMDGDASYVPLKWVAAVFEMLSEKLGDKRLFVLSILGLQSSGKSTLMNALFGLQFSVSAGRCTKGAYMQLLKVDEASAEELGFDFVLVVDTEGLRAPELSHKSQNRDNELATFVIGLANMTLINIFGENPSEMQDILQIAVQAFLRMKQVKIFPTCIFVHQNVGEVTAKDQTMEGRRQLEQKLDEMAVIAAKQEECSQVTRFGDVIKFDANTHVYYFAHLWDGNPPMAPPNPRYSHNVQELKSRILLIAKQESRGSILKISDVKFRVQDLWRALVSENFIFSFRNTREVMAMSKLETMYNHWTWELRSHMLDLQNQLHNQIQNGKILTITAGIIVVPVIGKYETIMLEFEKYFNEDPDREILVQWKANFENKLLLLKESLILDTRRKVNELISLRKSQERLDKKKEDYENQILERSQILALSVKGKEFSDEELHDKFNELWKKWVYEVSSTSPQFIEPNIDVDAENILLDYFKKEKNIIEKLKGNSGEDFQIEYGKHVQMSKEYLFHKKNLETSDEESINLTTHRIFSRFDESIKSILRQQRDYDQHDFHEIVRIIEEEVKSAPTKERYVFTSKYTIELSLCLFQRASKHFKEMHRAFKTAHDPVNYLECKKDDFFMSFKISCQGATSITSFVDFLCHKLTPAVSATIWEKMIIKITGDMRVTCPAFNGNRSNLEKHILISLAEEENFDNYWQYIHNPESFFRDYIENHVKTYYLGKGGEKIKTFFKISLDDIKHAILSAIHESTAVAKDASSTASGWLDLFCDHLGNDLIFPRRDLVSIEHQEIKDMEFLKEAMSVALDPTMKKVEQNYSSRSIDEMVPEIVKILLEHLCGCWKQCPFCKAICTNTVPKHDGDHSVPFHRLRAVIGSNWYNTDNFVIDCCSSLVASDSLFTFRDDCNIPYKDYRQAGGKFATWSITPDSSTQPYWKWFVSHFRTNLEEKYQLKFINRGQIPEEWAKITKQYVLDVLKKQ